MSEPEIVQKARHIIARDDHENATLKSRILRPGLTEEYQLAIGVVEFYEQATRMMDAEQERLLLASEDEIRKEILADGRDPDEYLKAMDTVMKVTGENAILKHDLAKALANHSADLSEKGTNSASQVHLGMGDDVRDTAGSLPVEPPQPAHAESHDKQETLSRRLRAALRGHWIDNPGWQDIVALINEAATALEQHPSARTESRGTCPRCGTVLVLQPHDIGKKP